MTKDTLKMHTLAALKLCASYDEWADIGLLTELVSDSCGKRQLDGSVSRRLRELREPRNGDYIIKCQRRDDGVYVYKLFGKRNGQC